MKRFKLLLVLASALCSLIPAFLYSQSVDTAWVRRYNGPGNYSDWAYSLAVDGQDNVYVTGYSTGSGTSFDYATIKYNSAGVEQWVQRYNGPGNSYDWANSLAVDGQSNVYVTGSSTGSGTYEDYATIKYDSNGDTLWVRRYNGPGNGDDWAHAIAVNTSGNVYVTGYSAGSVGYADYATIKYNSNGDTLWVRRYNGPGNGDDEATSLAVDGQGNVYVTGYSTGSGTSYDYATIKYNSNGDTLWVRRYNGPGNGDDEATSLAVDGQGNVYVTGYSVGSDTSADYATIKYDSAGVQQWVQRYNGPGNRIDDARAIAVDNSGNVYVTGYSGGDYATIKYNSTGIQQWVQRYDGPGGADDAYAIAVDGAGNVYVTGYSTGSGTSGDYATIKYVQTQGIEEIASLPLAKTKSIEVFPNPAKAYFTVRLPLNTQGSMLRIFDVTGNLVKEIATPSARNDNVVRIPLDGIKNGVYFVKVGNDMVKEKLTVTK